MVGFEKVSWFNGGLFDDEGRLLGITTSGIVAEGTQNLNFARPGSMIAELGDRSATALKRWRETQASTQGAPDAVPPVVASIPPAAERPPSASSVSKPYPPAAQRPQPGRTSTTPPPQSEPWVQPPRIASGFAAIDDVDAIPYLGDRGRAGYRDWLTKGTPRAFALAANGRWAATSGSKPLDSEAPVDPVERAVWLCNRSAGLPCRLYAVNNVVVWRAPVQPTAQGETAKP